jgi:SAM-dependent methyltransferase
VLEDLPGRLGRTALVVVGAANVEIVDAPACDPLRGGLDLGYGRNVIESVATTRAVYDATADQYATIVGTEVSADFEAPLDRLLLANFARKFAGTPSLLVGDLGTGVGRVAAYLRARAVTVVGLDLSPAMVAIASATHPTVPFAAGSLFDLPLGDGSLDGAIGWYSIIHTAPADLPVPFGEIARVLRPASPVLFGFQAGDGTAIVRTEAHGTAHTLTSYRHDPADVSEQLVALGFDVLQTATRSAVLAHETSPQSFVLARSASAA